MLQATLQQHLTPHQCIVMLYFQVEQATGLFVAHPITEMHKTETKFQHFKSQNTPSTNVKISDYSTPHWKNKLFIDKNLHKTLHFAYPCLIPNTSVDTKNTSLAFGQKHANYLQVKKKAWTSHKFLSNSNLQVLIKHMGKQTSNFP